MSENLDEIIKHKTILKEQKRKNGAILYSHRLMFIPYEKVVPDEPDSVNHSKTEDQEIVKSKPINVIKEDKPKKNDKIEDLDYVLPS